MTKGPAAYLAALGALILCLGIGGCSSGSGSAASGQTDASGVHYGSGPGHTRPRPQTSPPVIRGVPGVQVRHERVTSRGNKDYKVFGKSYEVWRGCNSYIEEGLASWYGPGFHGKKTSLGEVYNQKGYSAAHKNLPLPSYLKVTNLENGRSLIVRVNDRGPFHQSRIIDLSEGAAAFLSIKAKGTAMVRLEFIPMSMASAASGNTAGAQTAAAKNPAAGRWYVQLMASADADAARRSARTAAQRLGTGTAVHSYNGVSRVIIGPFSSESQARAAMSRAQGAGYPDSFVRQE